MSISFNLHLATITTVAEVDGAMIVPVVIMLDEPIHTAENGYRCQDETCPCHSEEDEVQQ